MSTFLILAAVLTASPLGVQPPLRPYDVLHYKIEVRLGDGGTFNNTVSTTLKTNKALGEIEFDAYGFNIKSVTIDAQPAEFKLIQSEKSHTGFLQLKPQKPIESGKETLVAISYQVTPGTSNHGLFVASEPDVVDALPGYFTHFEPNSAQRFMPLNDTPADKATSELIAVVDSRYQVVSNGKKVTDETFAEAGKNLRRVHWKQEQPHSPYLIALAIAQLEPVLVSEDIPSTLWVPPGAKARAYVAVDVLKGLYAYQLGFVGIPYPFAKLDVVAVPHFNWGGMENTSVIFERTSRLLVDQRTDQTARTQIVSLLSHEMAHQYFGDWVTCAWWNEIWLNEGFATYLGDLAADDYADNDEVDIERTGDLISGYFVEEDGPHSHPLVVKGIPAEEAFDATSYTKGANVLRMLELWVGTTEMKKIMKSYLEKNGAKSVTSNDFFKAVFEVTKKEKELAPFKEAWLNKKGYPVILADSHFAGGKLTLTIRQRPNHRGEKGAFIFKLPIVIQRAAEPAFSQEALLTIDKPEVKVIIDVPAAPEWINWNKNFGALAKIDPQSVSESQWIDAARHDVDSTWRLIATWQLLGELGNSNLKTETLPSDAAMGAILDVLIKDPSPYVREEVLSRLAQTRFHVLPSAFAQPLFALARRPEGLTEDSAGHIRVRRAAMEALGRVDSPQGAEWLLHELSKREVDINYLGGYAAGAARLGTPTALIQLRAALVTQRFRGTGFYQRVASALALSSSAEAIPLMHEVLLAHASNNEFARTATQGLERNKELRETQEFAQLVREVVLDEKNFNEEFRTRFLGYLDDVPYESAKKALSAIAAESTNERLKNGAKRALQKNFP